MLQIHNFKFDINISIDNYTSKADAIACLSMKGVKAVGRKKMAFKVNKVTVSEFLSAAVSGHSFCNLFEYDPTKQYWFQDSSGKWTRRFPEYRSGANKGGMNLCMKADIFFKGAQAIFVDIDNTRHTNVQDYLATLSLPPTCVYMSYSDKVDKGGKVSRRFRMVYVFDSILDKSEFCRISQTINDRIVFDTEEPMDDDCGTRMSQYMNGVYGNDETYTSDIIYSASDFPLEELNDLPMENNAAQGVTTEGIVFDEKMLADMRSMSYEDFMHYYSWRFVYLYRIEHNEWEENLYQLTEENFMQLWWYKDRVVDGQNRRRKLFKNACLRRLMFPDMDPDTALFNLYVDFCRFFDNSDWVIQLDTLIRKVRNAFDKSREQLMAYCDKEIKYWHENRPKFIVKSGIRTTYGLIKQIQCKLRYDEIDKVYNPRISLKANIDNGIGIPRTTLYRYCKERGIPTSIKSTNVNPRDKARKERLDKIELFKKLYDRNKSIRDNKELLAVSGLELSVGTISNWSKKYFPQSAKSVCVDNEASVLALPTLEFEIPKFNLQFKPKVDDTISEPDESESTEADTPLWHYSFDIPRFMFNQ